MGLRFRKTIKAGPVNINLSKSGIGASVGVKGARVTRTAAGKTRTTVGIPGTGISYTSESSHEKSSGPYHSSGPQKPGGRKPRHVAAWIFSIFFLISFFTYFPKFCSWFMLISGLILLPIPLLQHLYGLYVKKSVKVILVIVCSLLSLLTLPKIEKSAPVQPPKAPTIITESHTETSEASIPEAVTEAAEETIWEAEAETAGENAAETPADTAAAVTEQAEDAGMDYVLNKSTGKFHYPDCKSVSRIKPGNRGDFHGFRDDLIARGFTPCGNCHP